MGRPGENVNFDPATVCAYEVFDDDGVLVALVLHPESVFGLIDEFADTLSSVPCAPDQVGFLLGLKRFPRPIRIETLDDFSNLMFMGGDDGVIAGFRDVSCLPIQGLNEGSGIVD